MPLLLILHRHPLKMIVVCGAGITKFSKVIHRINENKL